MTTIDRANSLVAYCQERGIVPLAISIKTSEAEATVSLADFRRLFRGERMHRFCGSNGVSVISVLRDGFRFIAFEHAAVVETEEIVA